MDRVGGYLDYLALCEDARAYDDVLVALLGAADAARVERLKSAQSTPSSPLSTAFTPIASEVSIG